MAQIKKPIAINVYVSSSVTYRFFGFHLNKNYIDSCAFKVCLSFLFYLFFVFCLVCWKKIYNTIEYRNMHLTLLLPVSGDRSLLYHRSVH